MALSIGEKAPGFTLYDTEKNQVSLSDFSGKTVVLLFFPLAFTGVCTEEMCTMQNQMATYDDMDAQILAISVDSPFTLAKFKESEGLKFPLLSDFNKEVSVAYDSLFEDFALGMKGVSRRSAFVIDKEGIIRYAEILESAGDQPDYDAIKAVVEKLSA